MKAFRARDIPDSHKIAVYDALCKYFEAALDGYYTEPAPQDPRYDSGAAAETTGCVGLEVPENGWLNVVMQIEGWADAVGFSVELPPLTRADQADEGAWIEVEDEASLMHIHSEDLARLKEIAEEQAKGRPPIVGSGFMEALMQIALRYPQTFLELLRHIEQCDPWTPGPYE